MPIQSGDPVFGFKEGQATVWFHKDRERSNRYCLYCGRDLIVEVARSNKEHLIGREFVPTGTLDGTAFNLIFRGCAKCNDRKGALEGHISTVTLFVSPARSESAVIDQLARRKAQKDHHHKRGVLVKDAGESHGVSVDLGVGTARFGLLGPPQLNPKMAAELACRHVQGLFSLLTSTNPATLEGTRLLPPQQVWCDRVHHTRDWGNPRLGVVTTAQGFFRAEFRRDEGKTGQWFWALEWNKSTRILGVIAGAGEPIPLFEGLPELGWMPLGPGVRMRVEVPLRDESADLLFRHE
jgi:hypothetical protein